MIVRLRLTLFSLAAFVFTLATVSARANDFIDSRISFTLGDDNFFRDGGEQLPDSPRLNFSDREGYELPFDNLNSSSTGRENELHLVLYKKVDGYLPNLVTEVAAALEVDMARLEADSVGKVFSDDSSYIRLVFKLRPLLSKPSYLDVVLFPLSGDRFRVGYLYDMTWGGTDIFPRRKGVNPAFKIGGTHGPFYWWGGMKVVQSPRVPAEYYTEQGTKYEMTADETLYGVLAGIGAQPVEGLSIDLSGGHFQQKWNFIKDVRGELVTASGLSARIAYGRGLNVALSSDLRLLRNDREFLELLSQKPVYHPEGGVNWSVSYEQAAIAQVLADADLPGATTRQWATAGALDLRFQYKYLRMNFTSMYRSMQFSLLNTPSLTPDIAFKDDAIVKPQIFWALSGDYHFPRLALTPGLQTGVELPGTVTSELFEWESRINSPPPTLVGEHTMLLRTSGERILLPEGEDRVPIVSARLTARWYPSDILTLVAFVMLVYDENSTILVRNTEKSFTRVFDDPVRFGAGITAQARF